MTETKSTVVDVDGFEDNAKAVEHHTSETSTSAVAAGPNAAPIGVPSRSPAETAGPKLDPMGDQASNTPSGTEGAPGSRAGTLAWQGLANRIVRGMLRTPLVCRVLGSSLVTVYAVGRKSGRHYTTPVAYIRHEGAVLICTPFAWGRNLRTGEPIDIRLLGKRITADVRVVTDEDGVVELYGAMARGNHSFAQFNKISLSANGEPDPADLHLAWAAGARAFLLTPR